MEEFQVYCPREFARRPRSLHQLHYFKATEFRMFLLYYGSVVLKERLPENQLHHFNALQMAARILTDPSLITQPNACDYADELLRAFVSDSAEIYSPKFVTHNIHNLIHVVDDVKRFGPLDMYSCFPYESYLFQLKSLVRSGRLPVTQVFRRIHELSVFSSSKGDTILSNSVGKKVVGRNTLQLPGNIPEDEYDKFFMYNTEKYCIRGDNLADKYCRVDHEKLVAAQFFAKSKSTGDVYMCGQSLRKLKPLYKEPYTLEYIDICIFKFGVDEAHAWKVDRITDKFFAVPYKDTDHFVLMKMLHTL